MTRYLFYNATGSTKPDAVKALADGKDADTVLVPIDWTPESEKARDDLLKALGVTGISSLPCVVYFEPAHEADDLDENGKVVGKIAVPDRWVEHRFVEQPKTDWTWAKIDADLAAKAIVAPKG
jgi:hypothetical protein